MDQVPSTANPADGIVEQRQLCSSSTATIRRVHPCRPSTSSIDLNNQGVFGNVIISENFLETFGHPSANMQGTMTSIYNIGCFIGAMSTIWTGDILGRPRQIIVGSTIIAIGAIIQTASYSVAQMMVGRIVAGLGTGMNTATAGVWQAETSKMRSRGKLVIIQMVGRIPSPVCLFRKMLSCC